jgi:site-specific DNA-methyltransferase (adenine-specific)
MAESIVFNEDCMVGMSEYPSKYFDLTIVDPQYGLKEDGRKSASRSGFVKQKNGSKIYVSADKYQPKNWDNEPPDAHYFDELFRISKNQIIWGANHFGYMPRSAGWVVWDKCNDGTDQADCELAYTSFKCATRIFRFMWSGMMQGSLSDGRIMEGNKKLNEKRIHPTQKPVQLYKWLLQNYAKPGDTILDTHLGSGSSRIAAYEFGHDFIGYEKDPDYFAAQEKRFQQFKAQQKLFA